MSRRLSRSRAALVIGLLGAGASSASADPHGLMFTRETRASLSSAYVFRGAQLAEETAKLEGRIRFNGIRAGALIYQPLDDEFPSEGRLFGGWSPHIEDRGAPFDLEFGFTYYATLNNAPGFPDDNRFEPFAKLTLDMALEPRLTGAYDTERDAFSLEGGLSQYLPLGALNGLEVNLDGGYVNPEDAEGHAYAEGKLDLVRNFLNGVEGYVGLRGAVSDEQLYLGDVTALGPRYDKDGKAWVSVGLSAQF